VRKIDGEIFGIMLFASTLKALSIEDPVKVHGPVSLGRDPFRFAELVFTRSIASSEAVLQMANMKVPESALACSKVLAFGDITVLPIWNDEPKFLDNGTFDKTMWRDSKAGYELI
jgi:hypothetical protein